MTTNVMEKLVSKIVYRFTYMCVALSVFIPLYVWHYTCYKGGNALSCNVSIWWLDDSITATSSTKTAYVGTIAIPTANDLWSEYRSGPFCQRTAPLTVANDWILWDAAYSKSGASVNVYLSYNSTTNNNNIDKLTVSSYDLSILCKFYDHRGMLLGTSQAQQLHPDVILIKCRVPPNLYKQDHMQMKLEFPHKVFTFLFEYYGANATDRVHSISSSSSSSSSKISSSLFPVCPRPVKQLQVKYSMYNASVCSYVPSTHNYGTSSDTDDDILNWIKYHRNLGIEHVFLYDSRKRSNYSRIDSSVVTVIPWQPKSIISARTSCMMRFRASSDWLLSLDTIHEYLQIQLPSVMHTNATASSSISKIISLFPDENVVAIVLPSIDMKGNRYLMRTSRVISIATTSNRSNALVVNTVANQHYNEPSQWSIDIKDITVTFTKHIDKNKGDAIGNAETVYYTASIAPVATVATSASI